MGNPFANSLYRCQLAQLRDFIKGIPAFAPKENGESSDHEEFSVLLWLDTLCCPIGPPDAKRLALQKIRNVYEGAACVFVLDASLRAYEAGPMTAFEALLRILTCGWTRRLWTLQEGALAKALLFQFADRCIALNYLHTEMQKKWIKLICHRGLMQDIHKEIPFLRSFFNSEEYGYPSADVQVLDAALKHRSVTVATDEPLCISTLMKLNTHLVLSTPPERRMRVIWEQLVTSKCGVPNAIIFFTEPRLGDPGFHWAPASLLHFSQDESTSSGRRGNWKSLRSEGLTPLGLKVRFPGFCLSPRKYNDGLPRDPWPGSTRDPTTGLPKKVREDFIHFRTAENVLYRFCRQFTASNGRLQTAEEGRAWRSDMTHPLYDMSSMGNCALLLRNIPDSHDKPEKQFGDGLIVSIRRNYTHEDTRTAAEPSPVCVRSEGHIYLYVCKPSEVRVVNTIERLATHLRASELTQKLCAIEDQNGEHYMGVMDDLKEEMKRLVKEALDTDPQLVQAVNELWVDFLDHLWKKLANWYRTDVFNVERLPTDQAWIVD